MNQEKVKVEETRARERDEKLQNTLTLKLKRIETTLKEFQLLHFNVNSARIFFQVWRGHIHIILRELIMNTSEGRRYNQHGG